MSNESPDFTAGLRFMQLPLHATESSPANVLAPPAAASANATAVAAASVSAAAAAAAAAAASYRDYNSAQNHRWLATTITPFATCTPARRSAQATDSSSKSFTSRTRQRQARRKTARSSAEPAFSRARRRTGYKRMPKVLRWVWRSLAPPHQPNLIFQGVTTFPATVQFRGLEFVFKQNMAKLWRTD